MINKPFDISLSSLEALALFILLNMHKHNSIFEDTANKLKNLIKPHITYILRECQEIGNKYDYESIFKKKTIKESKELLELIKNEISKRNNLIKTIPLD